MTAPVRRYITVLLPLKLGWAPFYEVSPDENIFPGQWVRVIFANKEYSGIILETDAVIPDTDVSRIKRILSVERYLSPVGQNEIRLWKTVAEYYMCTVGEVFKAAYPAMTVFQQEALARMQERDAVKLRKILDSLSLKARKIKDRIEQKKKKLEETDNSSKKKEKLEGRIAELEQDLASVMERLSGTGTVFRGIPGPETEPEKKCREIMLTPEQQNAYNAALATFQEGKPVLIKGVTGSGKTEIYLKLALRTMSERKNVLYLVPEIAVSRQLRDRLQTVFGDSLLTFHSEETAAARRNTAEKIRKSASDGNRYIVLGTRSAIFLPHGNLGLIIVDEEHDSSYKQDSPAPRYNGRDVAVMMSVLHGCNIILGTATPSLESVFNCNCGKYRMLTLNSRYYDAEDAEIEIIDTAAERKKNGMTGIFSKKLVARISAALGNREQILIFRARRAFSPVLQCPECGEIIRCPHCNVSMSYHRNPERMVCHHCGFTTAFNPLCPKCGTRLLGLGSGTQKVEEETRALFPKARIARLDSDTAKTSATEIIRKFGNREIDIMIGTQIISKGFDFPGLALVAAISADSLLGIQDFRADEKALQILEQLRGRCGRRDRKGLFVIQTNQPEHPVYRKLNGKGNADLYESLMAERKEFGYPPFTRIINLTLKYHDESRTETAAASLAATLNTTLGGYQAEDRLETVSDPFSPPVDRVSRNYIRTIRLTLRKDRNLHEIKKSICAAAEEFMKKSKFGGQIVIDVDPE